MYVFKPTLLYVQNCIGIVYDIISTWTILKVTSVGIDIKRCIVVITVAPIPTVVMI